MGKDEFADGIDKAAKKLVVFEDKANLPSSIRRYWPLNRPLHQEHSWQKRSSLAFAK